MKKILGILFVILLITSSFISIVDVNATTLGTRDIIYKYLSSYKDKQITEKKIQLTQEQILQIDEAINNIKDKKFREKIREIINRICTNQGELNVEELLKVAKELHDNVSGVICSDPLSDPSIPKRGSSRSTTSTEFNPPYSGCFDWNESLSGSSVSSANWQTGYVGSYIYFYNYILPLAYGNAEGMQELSFYVGETKTISVDAEILCFHGKYTAGLGAFAGTYKTYSYNDFESNYNKIELDPWWDWNTIINEIILEICNIFGFVADDLFQLISLLGTILSANDLLEGFLDLYNQGYAETIHIPFSFTATQGTNAIWVGLRSSGSGPYDSNLGKATAAGDVVSITLDNYAAPNTPTITGPSSGYVNVSYEFCAQTTDPNGDQIQYKFDWGDGQITDWTDYVSSEASVCKTHSYSNTGTYTIKVKARDKDLLESDWENHTITIGNSDDPNQPSNPSPADGATNVGTNIDLSWDGGGGDSNIQYKIFFGTSSNPPYYDTIGPYPPSQTSITYTDLPTLNPNTHYYWEIAAENDHISIPGSIWDFTTIQEENNPPNIPNTPGGPTSGYTGCTYQYSTETTDPEDDQVYYKWDWGNGVSDWIGPYDSGEMVWNQHAWDSIGTYNIRVKAKDYKGLESDFSPQNTITIQVNQGPNPPTITGSNIVDIDTPVQFDITSTDPNGGKIKFGIDWKYYDSYGDPSYDEWTGYINSGETITVEHTFNVGGYYDIVVVTQDETGEKSNWIKYYMTVNGGNVTLEMTDTWTKPNRFIPNQYVELWFTTKNIGNRDGYNYMLYFYFDGKCILPYSHCCPFSIVRKTCAKIESGESYSDYYHCIWPNDYNEHEIKYHIDTVSAYLNKSAVENDPPNKPSRPSGSSSGKPGIEYTYSSSTTDPNEHQLYYKWNWGDGTESDWVGPYESGSTCEVSHTWSEKGSYSVKVKAKDTCDAESTWSDPLSVKMPRNRAIDIHFISRFLQNHPYLLYILELILQRSR